MADQGKRKYPNCITTAWVEINIVLGGGWSPTLLDTMSLDELAEWHETAISTYNRINDN